jgi:hypothetical protein
MEIKMVTGKELERNVKRSRQQLQKRNRKNAQEVRKEMRQIFK